MASSGHHHDFTNRGGSTLLLRIDVQRPSQLHASSLYDLTVVYTTSTVPRLGRGRWRWSDDRPRIRQRVEG